MAAFLLVPRRNKLRKIRINDMEQWFSPFAHFGSTVFIDFEIKNYGPHTNNDDNYEMNKFTIFNLTNFNDEINIESY